MATKTPLDPIQDKELVVDVDVGLSLGIIYLFNSDHVQIMCKSCLLDSPTPALSYASTDEDIFSDGNLDTAGSKDAVGSGRRKRSIPGKIVVIPQPRPYHPHADELFIVNRRIYEVYMCYT